MANKHWKGKKRKKERNQSLFWRVGESTSPTGSRHHVSRRFSWIWLYMCYTCYRGFPGGSAVQLLRHVRLFATPWTAACQTSLSFTIFKSFFKFMSIEWMTSSNHFIFLLPPSPHALYLFHHQCLFQWVSSSHQVAKVLELQLQHQSFQ